MTQGERASLERLEDLLTKRLDSIADDVKGIDSRLRNVEQVQATHIGALQERKDSSASRLQTAGIMLAAAMIVIGIPASAVAVTTFIQLVGG